MPVGWQSISVTQSVRAKVAALVLSACFGVVQAVLGGPPLVTDDPETPGRGGWEINISHNIEQTKDEFLMETPLFDINYGLLENDQWKIEFPLVYLDADETGSHWGIGDLLLGWKYRFLEEGDDGIMASIYPQLSAPTGNADQSLGSGRTEAFFPFEAGRHLFQDKVFVYGEMGYNAVVGEPAMNSWKYGLAAAWQKTEKLELMGEVGGLAFPRDGEADDVFFNFGFKRQITEHIWLIASCGRSFRSRDRGTPDLLTFVGLQTTWGGNASQDSDRSGHGRKASRSLGCLPRRH